MDTEAMRARLEAERERLLAVRGAADRLTEGTEGDGSVPAQTPDQLPAEQANLTLEKEIDQSVRVQAESELAEVEAALGRLRDGTYGRCEECGNPIGDERLEARPYARYCIEDQAKVDRGVR